MKIVHVICPVQERINFLEQLKMLHESLAKHAANQNDLRMFLGEDVQSTSIKHCLDELRYRDASFFYKPDENDSIEVLMNFASAGRPTIALG